MVVVVGSVVDVVVVVEVVLAVVVDPSVLDVDEPSLLDVVDPAVVVVAIVDEALVVSMTFSNETVAPPFACSDWTVSGHTTAVCLSRCTPPGPAPCTTTTWFSPVADSVRLQRAGTVMFGITVLTAPAGAPAGMTNGAIVPLGSEHTTSMRISPCWPAPSPEIVFTMVRSPTSNSRTSLVTSAREVAGPAWMIVWLPPGVGTERYTTPPGWVTGGGDGQGYGARFGPA